MDLNALQSDAFGAVDLRFKIGEVLMHSRKAAGQKSVFAGMADELCDTVIYFLNLMRVCRHGEEEHSDAAVLFPLGLKLVIYSASLRNELVKGVEICNSLFRDLFGVGMCVYVKNFIHLNFL